MKLLKEMELDKLVHEMEELQAALTALNSPVCFCHNDLQCGNIMYNDETKKLCFIDYEYGAYNFRGYLCYFLLFHFLQVLNSETILQNGQWFTMTQISLISIWNQNGILRVNNNLTSVTHICVNGRPYKKPQVLQWRLRIIYKMKQFLRYSCRALLRRPTSFHWLLICYGHFGLSFKHHLQIFILGSLNMGWPGLENTIGVKTTICTDIFSTECTHLLATRRDYYCILKLIIVSETPTHVTVTLKHTFEVFIHAFFVDLHRKHISIVPHGVNIVVGLCALHSVNKATNALVLVIFGILAYD